MKCFICQKEFISGKHVYCCAKKLNENYDKKEVKFKQICFDKNFDFTREYLDEKYSKKVWSLPDFKEHFGLQYEQTQFLLDYFLIPKRGMKEAVTSPARSEKYKRNCLAKYGVENISQLASIKNKKKETFLSHYGVDNIWKSSEYYEWLDKYMMEIYGKRRITNVKKALETKFTRYTHKELSDFSIPGRQAAKEKYEDMSPEGKKEYHAVIGRSLHEYWKTAPDELVTKKRITMSKAIKRWWERLNDEERNKRILTMVNNLSKAKVSFTSKLETKIATILFEQKIPYTTQFFIGRYPFDFLIGKNILLEVQGDYWHANPKKYKPDDVLEFAGKQVNTARDIWDKDEKKKKLAENNGYTIKYIWEDEINNKRNNEIVELLKGRLCSQNVSA